jgi:predicted enzyme related to lactoylglutathione lyase
MKKLLTICLLVLLTTTASAQKFGKIADSIYRICSNDGLKVFTATTAQEGDAYYVFYTTVEGDSLYFTEENFTGAKLSSTYGSMSYVRNIVVPFKNKDVTSGEANNKWRGGEIFQLKVDFPNLNIRKETIDSKGKKSFETVHSIMLLIKGQAKAEALKKQLDAK